MKRMLIACLIMGPLLGGCIVTPPPPTGFYWDNYSKTLYDYKKTPNEETLLAYQNALEQLIEKAQKDPTRKVPPGVYAELGQIYLDKGAKDEAVKWFQQEAEHFPESEVLVKTLIETAGK